MTINRRAINKIADVVRTALSLSVPITLEALCEAVYKLGGACISASSGELQVDAQITALDDTDEQHRFVIRYLEDKLDTRILFSIAHEMGHLFLHLLNENGTLRQAETFQRNMETTQEELEANEFAAALLMPEEIFIVKSKEFMTKDKINVTKMAEYFNVSVQAATVRGNVLELW